MRTRLIAALALAAATASCSGATPDPHDPAKTTPTAAVTVAEAPVGRPQGKVAPPSFRLPNNVVPTHVSAMLTLVPSEDVTKGTIDIDVKVLQPTRIIWLNAADITVDEASIEIGGAAQKATASLGGEDFVGFSIGREIPAGSAKIHAVYRGKVSAKDDRGVFRQEEGGNAYLYTQFENIEARRAFPCFDEPSFKIPWQLTIRTKLADTPLSNTPVVSETTENGWKTVRFAETKPLPSYLVAFAVGPFDIVSAGTAGRNKTPIRIVSPKGQGPETAFAASSTGKMLSILEEYFDIPYPYEKLDVVAIPRLATFGAMENAGLITIAARLTLAPPKNETPGLQRRYVSIMAHELAHQWFGDLVTMSWWDDIWLNEGFATWMGGAASEKTRPDFNFDVDRIRGSAWAMGEDSLISARKIRQEVESKDDIQNAFDGITYAKGGLVLQMFENWLGEEPFRKGIQRYLRTRAMGNATSADFLSDLSDGAGKDVRAAFGTFLDRPGVPLLHGSLACEKGKGNAKLSVEQERYLPLGSKGDTAAPPWQIPVCVRYGDAKTSSRVCELVTQTKAEITLPGATCPTWFALKDGGSGYYHAGYAKPDLARLLDKKESKLTLLERLSVLEDSRALVRNGKLPIGDALAQIPVLLSDKDVNPEIVRSALGLAGELHPGLVPDDLQPKLARFVSSTFGPKARALGWQSRPSDSGQERRLREELVPFVAVIGEDKALLEEAKKLTWKWFDDPSAIEEDMTPEVLRAAAWVGDRALFDRMHAELKKGKGGRRTDHLLGGLSSFQDPALVRDSLAITLTDEIVMLDAIQLLFQPTRRHDIVLEFLKKNIDALLEKVPTELRSLVIESANACDAKGRADVEALFKERSASIVGGPRRYAMQMEGISLCIAESETLRPSLKAFLDKK